MRAIQLTINGRVVSESVEPRMHLADLLRDRINLTGTHLRCEQGVCGACTLLIDGQPARSCITYAVLCDGAAVTTIEGLEDDPIMAVLRRTFSAEHGLQCGFCTPGMLVTARDIILRLPDADETRVRTELSGNLCRCTGYVGIVRAVCRALKECRSGARAAATAQELPLGPVGARLAQPGTVRPGTDSARSASATEPAAAAVTAGQAVLGLGKRQPNIQMRQSFTVSRPPQDVWNFFADIERVARCLPGASLTRPPAGEHVEGKFSAKLGPITATFSGEARITRDDARKRGVILGAGRDRLTGSRAAGEVEYVVVPAEGGGGTRVEITIRALLAGPLAQFGRSGIVDDLVARITETFAGNLEARLSGSVSDDRQYNMGTPNPLRAGSLLRDVLLARLKSVVARLFGRSKP